MECAIGGLGTRSNGGGDESSEMDGKGGRKSGICSGGSQFDERCRFLTGDEGFDIGERGRGGEDCLEGDLLRTIADTPGDNLSSSIVCEECEKHSSSIAISSSSSDSH